MQFFALHNKQGVLPPLRHLASSFRVYEKYRSDQEILSQPLSSLTAEAQKPEIPAAEDDEFFLTKKSSNTVVSDSLRVDPGVDTPDGDGNDEAGGDDEEGEGDDDEGGGDFVDFEAIGGDPSLTTGGRKKRRVKRGRRRL
ncbi:hypothetical protein GGU11DRAFT_748878 [Lentinula aff. detonsa]|nr:hypothetical protein GGU11DRAFT_748878 [Lentinula aff. detonsa]